MKPSPITFVAVATLFACTSPPERDSKADAGERPRDGADAPAKGSTHDHAPSVRGNACPAARPARWPNPGVAPLDPKALASALPERAEEFERNDIESHTADPKRGSDTWIRTYYDKKRANARLDVIDLAGQCRLGGDVAQQLFQRELRYVDSVGEPFEEKWFRERRFVYQKSAEGRALTTFLANRCRVTLTLEYGDSSRYVYELAERLDLDPLEKVCAAATPGK